MTEEKPDVQAELAALRAHVQALTEAQARAAPPPRADTVEGEPAEAGGVALPDFEEFLELLKQEVEDLHPLTCLAIFGLGVLTGRLLSN